MTMGMIAGLMLGAKGLGGLAAGLTLGPTLGPVIGPAVGHSDDALGLAAAAVRTSCYSCHGPDKSKSSLRLDGADGWLGQVDLSSPEDSELLYRVTLPADDPDAMPPEGDRLDAQSIAAIQAWIEAGAEAEALGRSLAFAEGAATRRAALLDSVRSGTGARIEAVRGLDAAPGGADRLSVTWSHRRAVPTAERLGALAGIAGEVHGLGLAGTAVTDAAIESLPTLPLLERVHLERTAVSDAGVRALLQRAPNLRYLNLYGTAVTADVRGSLDGLEQVVLFGTAAEGGATVDPFAGVSAREPRRILAADASVGRVALFRETAIGHPKLLWEGETRGLHDLQWLGDTTGGHGRVLFQETWTRIVEVDTGSGDVLWSYDAHGQGNSDGPAQAVEIHSFQRLEDGTTMVAESGRSRIVFVDGGGAVVDSFPLQVSKSDAHRDTRLVRETPAGTFLVAHEGDGVIREYTRQGEVIWSFDVPLAGKARAGGHGFGAHGNQAFGAIRLRGGDTLISTGNGHSFLRVSPAGEVVWDLLQDELEGVRFAWTTCVQELRSGNLVLGNCHAGEEQPQAVEVTPKGQLIWSFKDFEKFGNGLSNVVVIESTPVSMPKSAPSVPVIGPVIGELTETSVRLWGRALESVEVGVPYAIMRGGKEVASGRLMASPEQDYTVAVHVAGLQPGEAYTVTLGAASGSFQTLPVQAEIKGARIAFGSCASHDRFESQPIWTAIQETRPGALVLLGDTPYIDSTDLAQQRKRYVEFWQIPELQPLAASIPVVSTWDDHDFARNDQVGAQPGRENSRRAFVEYHPQAHVGDGTLGVYSSFRRGPVEVFVLDTRWFGDEEALGDDPEVRSLLGRTQREWLIEGLKKSTAEVKVLASGMVWNGAVRPGKRDHWGTWSAERDAIFAALGRAGVEGVVLVGGDIHRPRVIRHVDTKELLGYAPLELISSPLANHHIATAAAPHPGLVWDAKANFVALILEVRLPEGAADSISVEGIFIGPEGETLHRQIFAASDLARQAPLGELDKKSR